MTDIFYSLKRKRELELELDNLTKIVRAEVATEIETAKAHGDLSENAEYHAARERQAKVEDRISEITYLLNNGKIVEINDNDLVQVGHTVSVQNLATDIVNQYTIVGHEEQDIMNSKVSNESPIAKALLKKKVGDVATYNTPKGQVELTIITISTA